MCAELSSRWRSKAKFPSQLPGKGGVKKNNNNNKKTHLPLKGFFSSRTGDTEAHSLPLPPPLHTLFLKRHQQSQSVQKGPLLLEKNLYCDCIRALRAVSVNNKALCVWPDVSGCVLFKPIVSGNGKMRSSVSLLSKLWHYVQQEERIINTHTSFLTFKP